MSMKVFKRGKGAINIRKNDFVASGGEAKIYRRGSECFKIYHDRKKVPLEAKLRELSVLKRNNIINPIDIVLDDRDRVIGYTTKWIDGIPLCKVFVKGFRKRNGIKNKHVVELVQNMKKTIAYIHSHDIVLVDANEMNYIVGNDFVTPYFIDTTAWKTPSFPATVIMPSIRDWTTKKFTKMTDWFSFAVIACWLFTGVHPFKGKHDKYDKRYPDMMERMKQRVIDGISIFNSNVRIAGNADTKNVPSDYKRWFIEMFEKCRRVPPPALPGTITTATVTKKIIGSNMFKIGLLKKFEQEIVWYSRVNGIESVKTVSDIHYKHRKVGAWPNTSIVFTPKYQLPVIANIDKDSEMLLLNIDGKPCDSFALNTTEIMVVNNTMYCRYMDKFMELDFKELSGGNKIIPTVTNTWSVMPKATAVYAGCLVQNMLGKTYVVIPLPPMNCIAKPLPMLDDYRILDVKHSNHVLVVHAVKSGQFYNIVFRFNKDYSDYDVRITECNDLSEVNMVVLDNGVTINMPDNGVIDVFLNRPYADVKSVADPSVSMDMRLCKDGAKAMFFRGRELFTISMR